MGRRKREQVGMGMSREGETGAGLNNQKNRAARQTVCEITLPNHFVFSLLPSSLPPSLQSLSICHTSVGCFSFFAFALC